MNVMVSQSTDNSNICSNLFENYLSKISFKFPRGQWVKYQQNFNDTIL